MKRQLQGSFLVFLCLFVPLGYAAEQAAHGAMGDGGMMNESMTMSGPMMLVCAIFGLLVLILLVLGLFALVRYLRSK